VKVLGFVSFGGDFFLPNFHSIAEGKEVGTSGSYWMLCWMQRFSPRRTRYGKSEMKTPLASRWTERISSAHNFRATFLYFSL